MGAPANQNEALIKTCSEIVSLLAKAHENHETINLNNLRYSISKKHKLHGNPRLVDIIAAVPDVLKPALLPKLKAKPIRTASGVSSNPRNPSFLWLIADIEALDCGGGGYE